MRKHPQIDLTAFELADAAQRKAVQARKRKLKRNSAQLQSKSLPAAATPFSPPSAGQRRSAQQQLGDLYELRALEALRQAGCCLLARQLSCPVGELDLVVRDGQTLVFVEVRYRSNPHFGGALASISQSKQTRLFKAVQWWLPALVRKHFGGRLPDCRIDLITFEKDTQTWCRDAVCLSQDK